MDESNLEKLDKQDDIQKAYEKLKKNSKKYEKLPVSVEEVKHCFMKKSIGWSQKNKTSASPQPALGKDDTI